ncbi:MAG: VOC family protein, partial [Myxococcota bacterium]
LQAKRMEMPNGPYYVLEHEGTSRGGAMASDEGPAHWLAWVEVEDVDAAVARTASQGGTTLQAPFDVPTVGRMAVVADPTGARFGIIVPANS